MTLFIHLLISMFIWTVFFTGLIVSTTMFLYSDMTSRTNQIIAAAAVGDVFIGIGLIKLFLEGYFLIV